MTRMIYLTLLMAGSALLLPGATVVSTLSVTTQTLNSFSEVGYCDTFAYCVAFSSPSTWAFELSSSSPIPGTPASCEGGICAPILQPGSFQVTSPTPFSNATYCDPSFCYSATPNRWYYTGDLRFGSEIEPQNWNFQFTDCGSPFCYSTGQNQWTVTALIAPQSPFCGVSLCQSLPTETDFRYASDTAVPVPASFCAGDPSCYTSSWQTSLISLGSNEWILDATIMGANSSAVPEPASTYLVGMALVAAGLAPIKRKSNGSRR